MGRGLRDGRNCPIENGDPLEVACRRRTQIPTRHSATSSGRLQQSCIVLRPQDESSPPPHQSLHRCIIATTRILLQRMQSRHSFPPKKLPSSSLQILQALACLLRSSTCIVHPARIIFPALSNQAAINAFEHRTRASATISLRTVSWSCLSRSQNSIPPALQLSLKAPHPSSPPPPLPHPQPAPPYSTSSPHPHPAPPHHAHSALHSFPR